MAILCVRVFYLLLSRKYFFGEINRAKRDSNILKTLLTDKFDEGFVYFRP